MQHFLCFVHPRKSFNLSRKFPLPFLEMSMSAKGRIENSKWYLQQKMSHAYFLLALSPMKYRLVIPIPKNLQLVIKLILSFWTNKQYFYLYFKTLKDFTTLYFYSELCLYHAHGYIRKHQGEYNLKGWK